MDKQNKGDGIKIVISFILIFALGVSMFAIIKSGDKLLSNLDNYLGITTAPGTSVAPGTSGNSGTTTTPQQTTVKPQETTEWIITEWPSQPYSNGQTSYVTVDNVTYFFKYYEFEPGSIKSVNISGSDYGTYSNSFKYSYNASDWRLVSEEAYDYGYLYQLSLFAAAGCPYVYISYCSITNCNNPDQVLTDLNNNVFSNETYYDVDLNIGIGDVTTELPS